MHKQRIPSPIPDPPVPRNSFGVVVLEDLDVTCFLFEKVFSSNPSIRKLYSGKKITLVAFKCCLGIKVYLLYIPFDTYRVKIH